MKKLLTGMLLLLTLATSPMESSAQKMTLKAYSQLSYSKIHYDFLSFDTLYRVSSALTSASISLPFPALSFNSGKWFHEVQLQRIHFGTEESWVYINGASQNKLITKKAALAASYEFNYRLFNSDNAKWKIFLGTGIQPVFEKYKGSSNSPNIYGSSSTQFTTNVGLIPRVQYAFSEKWLIDVNINLGIYSASLVTNRVENPAIKPEERLSRTWTLDAFPVSYALRFGVGYNF